MQQNCLSVSGKSQPNVLFRPSLTHWVASL